MSARTDQFDSAFLAELQATEQLRAVPQELGVERVVGGGLMPYALDRVGIRGGNRLRARPAKLDGGTLVPDVGADVLEIARPWKLRHGLEFNTNLISFTTLPGDIDRALVAAEINGTTTSETWEVSPPYVENDIIWASPAQTGIAGVGLIDLNLDARAWIAVG